MNRVVFRGREVFGVGGVVVVVGLRVRIGVLLGVYGWDGGAASLQMSRTVRHSAFDQSPARARVTAAQIKVI